MEVNASEGGLSAPVAAPLRSLSLWRDAKVQRNGLLVRFVCQADPSRAFIAEAMVRGCARGSAAALAEGDPARVQPEARQVMNEIGIPVREGVPQGGVSPGELELVVVIRNRGLPAPTGVISWSFDDPDQEADQEAKLNTFRRVRDEIKRRVDLLLLIKDRLRPAAPHRSTMIAGQMGRADETRNDPE